MKKGIILICIFYLFSGDLYGKKGKFEDCIYETAEEIDAKVIINIERDNEWYKYTYRIKNLPTSKWPIMGFSLYGNDRSIKDKDFKGISTCL